MTEEIQPGSDELASDEVTSDEKTMAMLSHLAVFVIPVIGPLVMYFIYQEKSAFVKFHSIQAAIFQVVSIVLFFVLFIITCGMSGILAPLLWVPEAIFAYKAHNGEWGGYPMIDQMGR